APGRLRDPLAQFAGGSQDALKLPRARDPDRPLALAGLRVPPRLDAWPRRTRRPAIADASGSRTHLLEERETAPEQSPESLDERRRWQRIAGTAPVRRVNRPGVLASGPRRRLLDALPEP